MGRPSGPSIHESPNNTNTSSAASSSHPHSSEGNDSHSANPNDLQSHKSFCVGELSPKPAVSSPTYLLRSQIFQSPDPTSQVDGLVNSSVDNHQDQEGGNGQKTEHEGQSMEVDNEHEEEEENYDIDDVNDDRSSSQSVASDIRDDSDESMDLDLDSLWMTPDQLVNHVADVGVNGLFEEYAAIGSIKTNDPCTAFRLVFYSYYLLLMMEAVKSVNFVHR